MYKVLVAITLLQNRSVDDCHPRVQLKRIFAQNKFFFNESNNIQEFSKKFVGTEKAARENLNMASLNLHQLSPTPESSPS